MHIYLTKDFQINGQGVKNMQQKTRIKNFDETVSFFDDKIKIALKNIPENIKSDVQEIRLRANKCTVISCFNKTYFVGINGNVCSTPTKTFSFLVPSRIDIENYLKAVCDYSIYSAQEQIKNGFVTAKGGNRIGICGTAVVKNNVVTNIKNITSINLRVANEFLDCSFEVFEKIKSAKGGILIVGPPKCGKTTILRDLAKKFSSIPIENILKKVVIADERFEIAANFCDSPCFDVGFSDSLNGFPKKEAFDIAIRCLSPDIIICDELGANEDINAINQCLNAGVQIIASIHARSLEELLNRPQAKEILKSGAFEKIIFLNEDELISKIKNIYEVGKINL